MTWDGRYENSREGRRSLTDDIMDTSGKYRHPTSEGGTIEQRDNGQIHVYGPSDSPKGHSHDSYDITTNESKHHHD
jgi:hypothetical protein